MTREEFCEKLSDILKEKGMSLDEAGRIAWVCPTTIKQWMRGQASPRVETASILLNALGYKLEIVKA